MKIGILGDGQLGALTSLSAKELGYTTHTFGEVGKQSPAGQISEYSQINYSEHNKIIQLLEKTGIEIVTTEWENIPVGLLQAIEQTKIKVFPQAKILSTIQDRLTEKEAIKNAGCKTVEYKKINSKSEIIEAFNSLGKGIIKTTKNGYDGKGQFPINSEKDIKNLNLDFENKEYIYEQKEEFAYEISVIIARKENGENIIYNYIINEHENGILKKSIITKDFDITLNQKTQKIAKKIANYLGIVGLLTVEMFVGKDGEIKVNELAPRPHNSGHHSIESYNISQYEALIKAITNETFGKLTLLKNSVLENLLGNDIYKIPNRDPKKIFKVYQNTNEFYYDYGKEINQKDGELPKGRKMGHKVTIY